MNTDIKLFQKRYALSNRDMAEVCQCSLPTIQKWRSGEVSPAGPAMQLMRLLDHSAEGDPARFRDVLAAMNRQISPTDPRHGETLQELESSMHKVVDRLELMLESRRKDKELAESEARYRSMLESQKDPVCRWLPDTTLTYVNEAYKHLYCKFGDNLIGRKWIEFVPEDRRRSILALVSDIVRRGESETMVHESFDRDGQLRMLEWRDIPIRNPIGEVAELHSIGRDMTELLKLRETVKEMEKVSTNLMCLCDYPVIVFDDEGRLLKTNHAFRQEYLQERGWQSLEEMLPNLQMGRFKRLLKRLNENGQLVYQVELEGRIIYLKIRFLMRSGDATRYLALLEKNPLLEERTVLRTRLANEVIVNGEPVKFFLNGEAEQAVRQQMQAIGQTIHVDRVYFFSFDSEGGFFDNVLEWCATGAESHFEELQRIPMDEFPWWIHRLKKGQWIDYPDVTQMPRTAAQERQILQAQQIRAILVAPLEIDGEVRGFVGFDQNHTPRIWHSQDMDALRHLKEQMETLIRSTMPQTTCV